MWMRALPNERLKHSNMIDIIPTLRITTFMKTGDLLTFLVALHLDNILVLYSVDIAP